ncbi:MAG: DNA-binding protein WhiA [Clostridia bacterium]|nr:DNA-binding protein WhiA [Clostridia bacterium]
MSFTGDVKTELTENNIMSESCLRAYTYGFLLFGKSFSPRSICCASDYECVINSFAESIKTVTGVTPHISRLKSGKYTLKIATSADRKKIIEHFDHSVNDISVRINHGIFEDDECYGAFIKGVFLVCGTVSNPDKNYHLEFVVPHMKLSQDLIKLLNNLDINAKYIVRKYSNVVYMKDSENIEDVLTMMGAVNSSIYIMGIKVQKDVRNKINRRMNFESANMSRSIEAGLNQVNAIRLIEQKQGLNSLPAELKELAVLRLENPDMSLKELGESLTVPISRSGVNHRFEKIISIAEKYEK